MGSKVSSLAGTISRNRKWAAGIAIALAVVVIFYGYRYYGPTPRRTLRLFVRAFNAGDFDSQYSLFVERELANMPLLPKEDFLSLLKTMRPPFPQGSRISGTPTDMWPHHGKASAITVRVLDHGNGPPPTGQWSDYMDIGTQRTEGGWGVRGYFTYSDWYRRMYGDAARDRFKYLYLQAVYRRGLLPSGSGDR